MNDLNARQSLHPRARKIGLVWLLYFFVAGLGTFLLRGIVVRSDAVATATNLVAHAAWFRAGLAFDLVGNCTYIVLTVLLYGLFRPVDRNLARLATAFSLVGCATQIIGGLLRVAPFVLLVDNQSFSGFSAQQLQAAVLISLRTFDHVFDISFVLFGFFEIVLGYLILKSTFLPRWLGWLFIVAGIGGTTFLWPPFATSIFPLILALNAAELIMAIWLIVKGPGIDKWREQRSG
jgi:hypothetical protein